MKTGTLNVLGNLQSTDFDNRFNKIIYNLILAFFKLSVQAGLVVYNLVDGIMDEFEDETGVVTKINATYDAVNNLYSPLEETEGLLDNFEYPTDGDAQAAYVSSRDFYTKLLLHCDGTDGYQAFIDECGKTVTAVGGAQIDTAQKKFGTASGLFEGYTRWLTILGSSDFEFGNDDFTIDFWFYTNSIGNQWFFHTATEYWFGIDYSSNGTQKLGLWASSNGTSWNLINADGGNGLCATILPQSQWNHIAVVRNGDNWRVYLNGIVDLNLTVSGTIINRIAEIKYIGRGASGLVVNGWIDEFRISKGIARWTSNFTPPTSAYSSAYSLDILTNGIATADSNAGGGYEADKGCDDNISTRWNSGNTAFPHWWKYDLGEGVTKTVNKLRIYTYWDSDHSGVKNFILQGSNNDIDWTTIYTGLATDSANWQEDFNFSNFTAYRYYKLNFIDTYRVIDNYCQVFEIEMMEVNLFCYSESTIKTQGSYSLKVVAKQTDSLNKTLTRIVVSPPIDLTGKNSFKFDIEATRIGNNIKVELHNSNGYIIEVIPNITGSSFQTITTDISGVTDANKNVIDSIFITIVDASEDNIFYIDNMFAGEDLTNNMTLISTITTAVVVPTKSRIVLFEEDVDTITLNTDLKAYLSRDGGTTFTQHTLVNEGNYDTTKRILASEAIDISGQPSGTSMKWKIETLNNKDLKLHGIGTNWGD